jgi:hypothetical protein
VADSAVSFFNVYDAIILCDVGRLYSEKFTSNKNEAAWDYFLRERMLSVKPRQKRSGAQTKASIPVRF